MSNIVPYSEMKDMSLSVFKGGLFGLKSPEQALTLMMIAQSENIHPIQALQAYDIIQGRPALKASEVLSRYQKSGGVIQWIKTDAKSAKAKFIHPKSGEFEFEYTIEDAALAGLTGKDNWQKRPKEMLRARCTSAGVRMSYPACLNNMYTSDEAEDMPMESPSNPYGIPMPDMKGEYIDVEHTPSIDALKIKLANKLRSFNLSKAEIKQFADYYMLNEKEELLLELTQDESKLGSLVEEFEANQNIGE